MAKAYSLDLRERILKDYESGVPIEDLVLHYEVSRSWIYSLLQQRRETGSIAPRPFQPGRKQKLAPYEKEVREVVAQYLPPYSPDLNPIEMVFSKLKTLVRKAKMRTMETLWKKLGELCERFPPLECQNYFRHAGYNIKNVQTIA